MKALLFGLLVSTAACATSSSSAQRPINVHVVRVDIQQSIGDTNDGARKIYSMGKVTADSATVYTEGTTGRREESWNKGPNGWALRESHELTSAR